MILDIKIRFHRELLRLSNDCKIIFLASFLVELGLVKNQTIGIQISRKKETSFLEATRA